DTTDGQSQPLAAVVRPLGRGCGHGCWVGGDRLGHHRTAAAAATGARRGGAVGGRPHLHGRIVAYGASAPLVAWVSNRVPIRVLIACGTVAMAASLPLLALFRGAVGAGIGLSVVSVCYAFMLNPTSAELGDAVDRRGMTCYAAVYAIYNVAYAV